MIKVIDSNSRSDTMNAGIQLGKQAVPGMIVALEGNLGAGKTVFAKGLAEGLGIKETVNSPTFTVLQSYESGRLPLYHFDVYRIEDPDEMDEIGYEDCFFGNGVSLVEWAGNIRELIPETAIWVSITRDAGLGNDYRRITIES